MRRAFFFIALGLLALVAIVILIWLVWEPSLAGWRDIVVIAVGFLLLVWTILMIGVAIALLALVLFLRDRLAPLLDTARSTAENVQGTTGFVGERVVSPFIKVSAAAAGARAAVQALVRRSDER